MVLADSWKLAPTSQSRILIVDDDAAVTDMFARMLRLEGYDVVVALTAESGLREVDAVRPPDAVLLDLRMPLCDGLAFLRWLRAKENRRHTPVAVITSDYFLEETVARELHELDAAVYFKPLWFEDLVGITRELLRSATPS
jgi:DNA-binding response OmpR family regulator